MSQQTTETLLPKMEWNCRLSSSTLAWLVQPSLPASALSLFEHSWEIIPPAHKEMRQLAGAGLVQQKQGSDAWDLTALGREVSKLLASPKNHVSLRVWASDTASVASSAYYPGNLGAGSGIIANELNNGDWQLAGMVDGLSLAKIVTHLAPDEPEEWVGSLEFEAHTDSVTSTVLCAILDIGRTLYRRQGFLDVGLEPGSAFHSGEVTGYLEASWGVSRFDQLITYMPAIIMQGNPPTISQVDFALNVLVDADVLERSITGRYIFGEGLRSVIPALHGLRSGFQWLKTALLDGDERAVSNRVYLIGPAGAVFMISATVAGQALLKLCSYKEIQCFLTDQVAEMLPLESSNTAQKAGEEPEIDKTVCQSCQKPMSIDSRFCSHCGTQLIIDSAKLYEIACTQCGFTIREGAHFCTQCGGKAKR